MTHSRPESASRPSALDPFLVEFLALAAAFPDGLGGQSHLRQIGRTLDCDPAFVEALMTSAQRRGFLEVYSPPGKRGITRWRLSRRGEQFLNAHIAAGK